MFEQIQNTQSSVVFCDNIDTIAAASDLQNFITADVVIPPESQARTVVDENSNNSSISVCNNNNNNNNNAAGGEEHVSNNENEDENSDKRLSPCELQDHVWVKMSAVAAGVSKKRKKSDTKPQAQINKCNNEKRRREQENIYIEELAELISASFADMSSLSVKPDKCAILHETVNQIKRIREQERSRTPAISASVAAAVQQGEVSSSRPADILTSGDLAPLLLEALEGFLLIVSRDGRIEQCSSNIEKYIKYTYDEVVHQELFNFIHLGDTARFSSILKPPLWSEADPPQNRSFTCRFLVKPPDDRDAPLDERQQRIDKYEQMHICSAEVLYPPNDENAETCLMCIARRIPQAEKAATATSSVVAVGGVSATGAFDQFSTKLDTDGKIESIDTSAVSSTYAPHIHKRLVGIRLAELCIPADASRLAAHLRDTIDSGATRTSVFRLRLTAPSKQHVSVQTTSKFFKCELDEYIMSTHFIIGVSDLDETESSNLSIGEGGNNSNSTTPVGGPLMTSVMNGAASVATPSPRVLTPATTASGSLGTPTPSYNLFSSDHELFFPTSTWDMDLAWGDANVASTSRPGSRHSAVATPVSTPTPSLPSASPCMPSPLQSFSQPQPSPVANTGNPATPSSQFPPNFPFSPLNDTLIKLEDSSSKENMDESMNDSGRLRNLLTNNNTKRVSDMATNCNPSGSAEDDGRNKNRILKGLLNQDDDDESKEDSKISLRGLIGNLVASGSSQLLNQDQPKTSTGNNMLLSLLNDKSDDDDVETRAGLAKPSELLQRLMKGPEEDRKPAVLDSSSQDDLLLRNLGFTNSPSPPGRKRSSDEATAGDEADHQNKRSASDQVSSTGNSKLWEKNKMLASLLAKQPSSTPIPTLPARVISATPQELPRVGDARKMGFVFNKDVYNTSTTTTATTSTRGRAPGRPVNSMYLNQIMMNSGVNNSLGQNINNNNNVSAADMNSRVPTSIRNEQGFSGPVPNIGDMWGDTQNDPILSDLLDQVIDIVPDAYVTDSSTIMNILDALEAPQNNNIPQLNEKMAAINAIQKSLMQCESAVKSPPSPNMSMNSGTPPAYSINSSSNFPPPPGYSQQQQQRARFTGVRNNPQYAVAGSNLTQQQQLLLQQQQRTKLFQQQEQKRRLLQQQQQQQLLIPSNATAAELNSPLTNINSLMNTTVAPNVSLQRSSSVPDSPVYNMNQQRLQQQPQAQAPFSPTYTSQQTGSQYQGGSRLSPHSANPRPPVSMYQPSSATSPQQGAWGTAQSPSQQTQQTRLGLSQQQNPMLNAQLTGAGYQNRPYTNVQRPGSGQRSGSVNMVGSPSSASPVSRQSPYQSSDGYTSNSGGGPPNARSPTPPYTTSYQQQLQHRLQRTISAPSATTHLPGGLGSPRHYHAPPVPPSPYSPPQHGYDTMQPPQYCYDQTGLQLVYNGADRGRAPPPPPGGGSNAINSEYVRQELRAVVGARTASVPQQQQQQGRSTSSGSATQQQVTPQLPGQPQVSAEDFEALGLTFEMPPTGASDSPKLWGTMGSNDLGSPPQASAALSSSSSRSIMEETAKPGDQKSSLLQKLLSE